MSTKSESDSKKEKEENWPWVWAIRNVEHLDWKRHITDSKEIEVISQAQHMLPVCISSATTSGPLIYLSDARHAWDIPLLKERGITHVLNVAGNVAIGDLEAYQAIGIKAATIEAEDEEGYPMLARHLEQCMDFIKSANSPDEKGDARVLVHCVAGLNRSGVIVAAYKMLTERTNVLHTVAWVRRQRGNLALCNDTFIAELVSLARSENLLGPPPGESGSCVPTKAPQYGTSETNESEEKSFKDLFNF